MAGAIKMLVFFILLLLVFWMLNISKHIRAGGWKGSRQAVDIIGGLLILGLLIMTALPLFK